MSGSADKTRGDAMLIDIKSADVDWIRIGGQNDGTITRSKDAIETTDKDSGGWNENIDGFKSWELAVPCFFEEGDQGQQRCLEVFTENIRAQVRFFDGTRYHQGFARCTSYEQTAPLKEASNLSITFTGDGSLQKG